MKRRGFFGAVLGLLGVGVAAKAAEPTLVKAKTGTTADRRYIVKSDVIYLKGATRKQKGEAIDRFMAPPKGYRRHSWSVDELRPGEMARVTATFQSV